MTENVRTKIQEISQGQDGFTVGWRYRRNWKSGEGRY